MASLPTDVTQIPEAMAPSSEKSTHQSPQSNPLANQPALDVNVHHQPPQLQNPLGSEPAEQWASSTLHAVTDDTQTSASAVSTPGPAPPGAYPSLLASKETVQTTTETTTSTGQATMPAGESVASGAADTAKSAGQAVTSGVVAAEHAVVDAVKAAGATAAQYLPPTIASRLPGTSSEQASTEHTSHSTVATNPTGNPTNGNASHTPSTAVADPTGNPNNGLEGLSGQSLAKLPEERRAEGEAEPIPYAPERSFGASYLNPVVIPDSDTNPAALPPINVFDIPENRPSVTHLEPTPRPAEPSGADIDASTKSLAGTTRANSVLTATAPTPAGPSVSLPPSTSRAEKSLSTGSRLSGYSESDAHRGTQDSKPLNEELRGKGDPYIETLREHDAAKKSASRKVTDTIVASVKEEEHKERKAFDRHAGTGESKPLHESFRTRSREHPQPPAIGEEKGTTHSHSHFHSPKSTSTPMATPEHPVAVARPVGAPEHPATETAPQGSVESPESAGRKSGGGFMSKVRGEMMVLSGKLTHSAEKVEEGRRLMGRQ